MLGGSSRLEPAPRPPSIWASKRHEAWPKKSNLNQQDPKLENPNADTEEGNKTYDVKIADFGLVAMVVPKERGAHVRAKAAAQKKEAEEAAEAAEAERRSPAASAGSATARVNVQAKPKPASKRALTSQ